jgi:hypothetical protein
MANEHEPLMIPVQADLDAKVERLERRTNLIRDVEPVTDGLAFGAAVVGLFSLIRRDRVGTLASGGLSLLSVAASVGLRAAAKIWDSEVNELENPETITGKDSSVISVLHAIIR